MKQKKKMTLLGKTIGSGLGVSDSGHDSHRDHGFLADDPGIYHVTADRIQCEHALE